MCSFKMQKLLLVFSFCIFAAFWARVYASRYQSYFCNEFNQPTNYFMLEVGKLDPTDNQSIARTFAAHSQLYRFTFRKTLPSRQHWSCRVWSKNQGFPCLNIYSRCRSKWGGRKITFCCRPKVLFSMTCKLNVPWSQAINFF